MPIDGKDLRADTINDIRNRIAATLPERRASREKVSAGYWRDAEPDDTRVVAYEARLDRKAGHAEASRGTSDFQPAAFLPDGAKARRAVARTLLDTSTESRTGTGFMISPDLFLSNQHVMRDAQEARLTQIAFDYELDERGEVRPQTIFSLDPDTFYLSSDEAELDFALVAVGARAQGSGTLAEFGYCPISRTPDRHQLGINANIVQHPDGRRKLVVMRNNLVLARDDVKGRLYYETDTLEGSSGSPVFNDLWDVIALHHYGEAAQDISLGDGTKTRSVNEGIRISSIYDNLSARLAGLTGRAREMLEQALVLWKSDVPQEKTLTPAPRSANSTTNPEMRISDSSVSRIKSNQEVSPMPAPSSEVTIVLPLEITIRVATSPDSTTSVVSASVQRDSGATVSNFKTVGRDLQTGTGVGFAEAKRLDRNYSNRNGFSPRFVPGIDIDLATVVAPMRQNIAPLLVSSNRPSSGELTYENFSVIMDRTRQVAMLTATNIDGSSYLSIDRNTGQRAAVQPRPEGDTWYKDTRIDEGFTLTDDFYGEWSHIFDRGHLTRRNDPTWGANAVRANLDTFHFTNCSPQHWQFNQSTKFWQGIERYVLEQGLWETGFNKPLTVLQGPLYDAPQPLFADNVQIPNAFWKIVVWNGRWGLKAVALVADQNEMLSIKRRNMARPEGNEPVEIAQFRVTVDEISRRSGLNLLAIAPYDTASGDLPRVGEARRRLTSFDQISLS